MQARFDEVRIRPVPDDEDVVLVAEADDEVFMTKTKGDEIMWSRLSAEEQRLLQEAKREACMVFVGPPR